MVRSFLRVGILVLFAARAGAEDHEALRQALGMDPVRLHLVGQGEIQVGGLVVSRSALCEEVAAIPERALVVVTSEAGIAWECDIQLRQDLVASGRPRDVLFVLPARAEELVAAPRPLSAEAEGNVARCIEDLGAIEWERREEATRLLCEMGPEILPALRAEEVRNADLEVLWRLDRVIETLGQSLAFEQGFLGISYHYRAFESFPVSEDGRRLEGAIDIQSVIQGSEAERIGLASGDLVYAINGKPVATQLGTNRITRIFSGLRRGETIELAVLRDAEDLRLSAVMGAYGESRR